MRGVMHASTVFLSWFNRFYISEIEVLIEGLCGL